MARPNMWITFFCIPVLVLATLEDICRELALTSKYWHEGIKRTKGSCPDSFRSLGPAVIQAAKLSGNFSDLNLIGCYDSIARPLCALKFEMVGPVCKIHTVSVRGPTELQ
eukprot:GHVO01039415.1.p1 GENE.GHVO01039415.1~~GHVO01039415.1.p1  ORF type:complete len:110 (-),score=12.54 GHVO01039415.1:108-437(-)